MKLLKFLWKTLLFFFSFIVIYFLLTIILMLIPVNSDFEESTGGVPIYLRSNGMHTEFGFPLSDAALDWDAYVDFSPYDTALEDAETIWFGWGDRAFYLDVPSWDSLEYSIVLKAAFLPTEAIMQITLDDQVPSESDMMKKVMVSRSQLLAMESFIISDIKLEKNRASLIIHEDMYRSRDDKFFLANKKYTMLNTCNTWTNDLLISAGVRAATWTPWDKGILSQFD